MQRLCFLMCLSVLLFSCKPQVEPKVEEAAAGFEIAPKEWPKKLAIESKIKSDLLNWEEYVQLETSFDALYKVDNTEDLSLVINDLLENIKILNKASYPEKFDIPQVKGRISLFETFVLKVQGDLHYRLDVQNSSLEMIKAYNAFRGQFNIIANNTLDTRLLFEEEFNN